MHAAPKPLPEFRRILTGIDAEGRSFIQEDGPPPRTMTVAERPGYRNANIWRLLAQPRVDDPDTILEHRGVLPPPGGVVFRIIDVPPLPKDREEARRQMAAVFNGMFPDAKHDAKSATSPGMHITDTVDFAVCLAGEIVAIMDRDETTMRTGDILIQRGTSHSWENRSDEMARMLFVLCDAVR